MPDLPQHGEDRVSVASRIEILIQQRGGHYNDNGIPKSSNHGGCTRIMAVESGPGGKVSQVPFSCLADRWRDARPPPRNRRSGSSSLKSATQTQFGLSKQTPKMVLGSSSFRADSKNAAALT